MELAILKKKLDGFRGTNGSIQKVSPEVLWELRNAWENFTGPADDFRRDLGVKQGTLRNLLVESKKLNHVLACADGLDLSGDINSKEQTADGTGSDNGVSVKLELILDHGEKVILFPNVDTLIDFLRRAA